MAMDISTLDKFMTVGQMRIILDGLDSEMLLSPNTVRNISVWSKDKKVIGFIDFLEETLELREIESEI